MVVGEPRADGEGGRLRAVDERGRGPGVHPEAPRVDGDEEVGAERGERHRPKVWPCDADRGRLREVLRHVVGVQLVDAVAATPVVQRQVQVLLRVASAASLVVQATPLR